MSAPLFGLVGYAQSGKDTFAGYLGFRRIAFADALKSVAEFMNPVITPEYERLSKYLVEGWEAAKTRPGVREYLQNLGMAMRSYAGESVWVDAAFKNYDPALPTVFTDVRFQDEYDAIRARGGQIIRIVREGQKPANGHVSEQLASEDYGPYADYTLYAPWDGVLHLEAHANWLREELSR